MKIDNKRVQELAHLCKLEFEGDKAEKIRVDLENIVVMCEKMNDLDTEGVEPLIYMTENENLLRDDEVKQTITHEEALKNAPAKDSDFFRVPKFIEQIK